MLLLVDTVRVAPSRSDEYLRLIETDAVPIMRDAGATLVSCWRTSADLGEDVDILVVWSVGDHARWNETRRNLVLDPRWHRYARTAARLRNGGTRRFYERAPFSPDA
jgi:hypothetical protein